MKPFDHQIKGVEFLIKNNGVGAYFWEVGCGKTIGSLMAYQYLFQRDLTRAKNLKLLIICPLSLIEGAWIKEIERFIPDAKWYDLHSNTTNFKGRYKPDQIPNCDIYIINFEYLLSKNKFEELILMIKLDAQKDEEWMCIIDESSKMKNHQAKITERILELKKLFIYRLIMSGTPAPNIEWEYFSQMLFLDEKVLGANFHKFKNICFALKRGSQVQTGAFMNKAALREMFKQGFKYEIVPARRVEMFKRMQPFCDFVKQKDCLDLPKEIDEYRIIDMTPEQAKIYKSMKETFIAEIKHEAGHMGIDAESSNVVVANMVLTKFMKLRQITSGFAIDENEQAVSFLKTNPKTEALLDIIEECPDKQIIVWAQFKHEMRYLKEVLEQHGGCSILYGEIDQKDRQPEMEKFLSKKNRFLLAHPRTVAHGHNLQYNSHIQVFYSLSYSFEEYAQSRGRTMRHGQEQPCIYFHILAKNSIDQDILGILQKKTDKQAIAEKYLKGG